MPWFFLWFFCVTSCQYGHGHVEKAWLPLQHFEAEDPCLRQREAMIDQGIEPDHVECLPYTERPDA